MSNAGSKPESDPVVSMTFFLIMLGLVIWAVWHFFKTPILEVMRWIRFSEMWFLNLFVHHYDSCLAWIRHAQPNDTNPSVDMIRWTQGCFGVDYLSQLPIEERAQYYMLSAAGVGMIESGLTVYYRWPIMAALGAVAVYAFFLSPRGKFRTRYNLEQFIKVQAGMWPVIAPIVNFNPIKSSARTPGSMVPDKLPLFAEALSPEEWISWHRIPITNNTPDREATRRAFLLQLGPRWNGIEGQPPYIQALFAAYALKGAQKREESDDILGQIAMSWSAKGGFKMNDKLKAEVKRIVKDKDLSEPALKAMDEHAYRTTAMLGLLQWARSRGGVLAPAQFLWLRGTDRSLWYALNNLGRRAFHTEGSGALAHFMAEQNAHKPLPIPRIDTAIIGLNTYLTERKTMPIPPREEAR